MNKKQLEMKQPAKSVTLRTLAKHLGLSTTTVSVVLSDAPAAKEIPIATRVRVLNAAKELQYRPSYLARSLRNKRTMSVGVIVPEIGEGYFALLMNGIEEYLLSQHYFYFTASHYWKQELLDRYPRMLAERAVEGFLFLNTPPPRDLALPAVTVSSHMPPPGITNIALDHDRAAVLALTYLKELRHRKIAFMRGQSFSLDSDERWKSIVRTANQMGITIDEGLCITLERNTWSPVLGFEPTLELLKRRRDFTALFCFNDTSAFGAIRALQNSRLRVPQDVSVIGFDDVVHATFSTPSLTTVRQPLRQMGHTAAELLLRRITQPREAFPPEILMQPELIVRESTSARRSAKAG